MSVLKRPLVCPVIVGRERELDAIASLCNEVETSGAGRALLVTGEAGIGKSRLVDTAVRGLSDRWTVFRASAYEQDRGLPYGLTADLVERIVAERPESAHQLLEPAAAGIARLLPALSHVIDAPKDVAQLDPAQEKRRLFVGLERVLSGSHDSHPVVVLLEDVHWADRESIDFIGHLLRGLARRPLLVVLTYRPEETSRELERLLAQLARERASVELPLDALSLVQMDAMVRATLGRPEVVRADRLHALFRSSGGVPFLVEELLHLVTEVDAPTTDARAAASSVARVGLVTAIGGRLTQLSPQANELLRLAAVVGDRFELPVLEALCDLDAPALFDVLRELAAGDLLIEVEPDVFRFRHALTRDAILAQLIGRERRQLHLRVAGALEADTALPRLGELAYHLDQAGAWERTLHAARAAGEQALAVFAPAAAIEQLSRAVAASEHLGRVVDPQLRLLRAQAFEALGDFGGAREDLERAARDSEASGDTSQLISVLLELGLLWASRDYAAALPHLERAERHARELGDPATLARALGRLGNWHSNAGAYASARRYLDEALELCRAADNERGIAESLDLLGMAGLMGGRPEEAFRFEREAAERFRALGDLRTMSSSLATIPVLAGTAQTSMLPPALRLAEATAFAEAGLEAAERSHNEAARCYALWQLGFALAPQGKYARAFEVTHEALEVARRIEHLQWELAGQLVLGTLHLDLGDPGRAIDLLQQGVAGARAQGSILWVRQGTALLAGALLGAGRHTEAAPLIEQALGELAGTETTMATHWLGMVGIELALARGEAAEALARLDRDYPEPAGMRARRARGLALLALRRLDEAATHLRESIEAARDHGDRAVEWRLTVDLARAELERGDRTSARALADEALEIVATLASGVPDPALATALREHALHSLPATLRSRPERASDGAPLSPRELEVARLVALGRSNRGIADELVVSVRTVETHVGNAMARLGFTSRTQLASWVVQHGLAEGDDVRPHAP